MTAIAQGSASIHLGLGVIPACDGLGITQRISPDPAANGWRLVRSNSDPFHATVRYGSVPVGRGVPQHDGGCHRHGAGQHGLRHRV